MKERTIGGIVDRQKKNNSNTGACAQISND
jgi:hypothetical protein